MLAKHGAMSDCQIVRLSDCRNVGMSDISIGAFVLLYVTPRVPVHGNWSSNDCTDDDVSALACIFLTPTGYRQAMIIDNALTIFSLSAFLSGPGLARG